MKKKALLPCTGHSFHSQMARAGIKINGESCDRFIEYECNRTVMSHPSVGRATERQFAFSA